MNLCFFDKITLIISTGHGPLLRPIRHWAELSYSRQISLHTSYILYIVLLYKGVFKLNPSSELKHSRKLSSGWTYIFSIHSHTPFFIPTFIHQLHALAEWRYYLDKRLSCTTYYVEETVELYILCRWNSRLLDLTTCTSFISHDQLLLTGSLPTSCEWFIFSDEIKTITNI